MAGSDRFGVARAGVRRRSRWGSATVVLGMALATTAIIHSGTGSAAGDPPAEQAGPDARDDLQPVDAASAGAPDRSADQKLRVFATGDAPQRFLIRFAGSAVPAYDGDVPGLAPSAPEAGAQLDPADASARAYRTHLVEEQVAFVDRMQRTLGRDVAIPFTYQYAVNGIAAVLTPDEARQIADDPAVVSITQDQVRQLHTDVGPQWEGADALWNAMAELGLPANIKGEGVLIGTIDTGISPGNRSFADVGSDLYDHTNPLGAGNYLGVCNPANPAAAGGFDPDFPCNDKLIGAYVFDELNDTALDYDSHGSHTASTSGGNVVDDVTVAAPTYTTPPFDISGVAPHANVVSYLACCSVAALTAAIDQAIADEVDVINYSIGSSSPSAAWDDFDTLGFLNARSAGIFVATSAGNDGPGAATLGSPADAPWITSVGAESHNRVNMNALVQLTSTDGTTLGDIQGRSVTSPLPAPVPIMYAGDVDDPFCDDTEGHAAAFTGHIVVCDRGGLTGRVQKSVNVAGQGAVGFVITNNEANGNSIVGDPYAVPGLAISFADGQALKAWLAAGSDHTAGIAGTTFVVDDAAGDVLTSFSSRGVNRAIDIIVPQVVAPGLGVLAAVGQNSYDSDEHSFISGTSMASPHVAGAGALLTQARPDWSPAQMQSALMTTARPTVVDFDGTPATPYEQGAGAVNVGLATMAGLLFDETLANYMAANPDEGGDPKTLNLPSFADTQCLAVCSWTRTASVPDNADGPVPANVTWAATVEVDEGLALDVSIDTATVSPGDTMSIEVTADVGGAPVGETLFGRITLTPDDPAVPTVTMPVAVVPSSGVLPVALDVTTRRDAGSQVVTGIESIAVSEFTGTVSGLVKAEIGDHSLTEDATNTDPYDDLSQVDVHLLDVPAGATRLIAETLAASMPDLDLYVGTGSTPSLATEVCFSATGSNLEHCDVPDPEAGTWWVLIQNWEASDADADTYTLATGVVPGDSLGNAGIDGPDGPVDVGVPYDIRFHWDLPAGEAGDIWYGTAALGSSPGSPGDIGSFPVTLHREEDDVTKTASVSTADPGDTVHYDVTVQPNVTPSDLVYTIVDTVPDGLTVDPTSVTGGGVVDGQTITWEVPAPSPLLVTGSYVASTPATNPQCATWSGFIDLALPPASIPLNPALDGDTTAANAFANVGPFELYGQEFPNLVVAEDGLVTVAGGYGGEPWVPQAIPSGDVPNGVLAPLWSDLELSVADGSGMRLATVAALGAAVVQWDNAFEFTGDDSVGPSVGRFQAWIYNTVDDSRPEATFEYGDLGDLPALATIGVEDVLGELATSVVSAGDPGGVLTEGGTICLDFAGPSFDPITVGYDVTVDAGTLPGTYTNQLVHVTDDPYAEQVTIGAAVEVGVACARTIDTTGFGTLTVSEGVTCLDGATWIGPIKVRRGAGLQLLDSTVVGGVKSERATLVMVCDSEVLSGFKADRSAAVMLGNPEIDCAPNLVVGGVKLTKTDGPSIVAGNLIVGPLACSGNQPPPVNLGERNLVVGRRSGQCARL